MNRRRILSSVHRSIARHDAAPTVMSHATVAQMSIAQLDTLGARLLPTAIEVCPVCLSTGEVQQQITDSLTVTAQCAECGGRGYYVEETR